MPNVMAALPNIGGTLCKSSAIPFLVLRRKVQLTPVAGVPAVMLPKQANARLKSKVNFALGKILSGGKSPRKCIYSVPELEMAKHCVKCGWPLVSNLIAVTKARRETC